jgi:hypothetical protein
MCVRDIEFTYFYDFLLNAGTVPTVIYIFFHIIIGYEKNSWVAIAKKNMFVG